jgi:DNA-binding winged helix-turn-helix (wHTH) protein
MARFGPSPVPRYRFSDFVLSPRRRLLVREGQEQPLIPRYFDLLVFLVERRGEAVHRRDILDRVWGDVVVSDSALSQAIRTIRRVLGDDSREPRFVRTVSRHGYRFVYAEVVEEEDGVALQMAEAAIAAVAPGPEPIDPFEPLLERLTPAPGGPGDEEDQREAAELLHALGTTEALRRLGARPGHTSARALLRDSRWDVAGAGAVPIAGQPGALSAAHALVMLRLRRAAAVAAARWAGASLGGGVAGAAAGVVGGLLLTIAPGGTASIAIVPVLAVLGGVCGAAGGAGVGAGLAVAESVVRSRRALVLVAGAALGGGLAGLVVQWLGRWTLAAIVGVTVDVGGGLEGVVIGAAAGLGYLAGTSHIEGGPASPRGRRRLAAAGLTALACGLAALGLTLGGRPLVGGTLHAIAQRSQGSQATLAPLGRFIGEPDFGPRSAALLGTGEGAIFGFGLAIGLTRRPRS